VEEVRKSEENLSKVHTLRPNELKSAKGIQYLRRNSIGKEQEENLSGAKSELKRVGGIRTRTQIKN